MSLPSKNMSIQVSDILLFMLDILDIGKIWYIDNIEIIIDMIECFLSRMANIRLANYCIYSLLNIFKCT